jgi:hypothetical protein
MGGSCRLLVAQGHQGLLIWDLLRFFFLFFFLAAVFDMTQPYLILTCLTSAAERAIYEYKII